LQRGDGVRVADNGEVGVLLPMLEHLGDAGVYLGVVGELGPGGEVGAELVERFLADVDTLLRAKLPPLASLRMRVAKPVYVKSCTKSSVLGFYSGHIRTVYVQYL
jgi:hypothetical protein